MALRRKRAETVEVEAEALVSEDAVEQAVPFWKKEISLKRKPKAAPAAAAVEAPVDEVPEPAEAKPSIWKRELSLGRKPKQQDAPAEPAPAVEDEPAEKPTPFWKKELSFGRKKKEQEAPAQAEPADDEESWNRDLIFGSGEPEAVETETAPEPEPEPEPLPEPVFFELPAAAAEEEPDAAPEPAEEPEAPSISERPWAAAGISPSVSSAYGWLTDDLEPADLASTSWAGTSPPIPVAQPPVRESAPEPDPVAEAAPEPEHQHEHEHEHEQPEPEPVLATVEPPPLPPVAEPEPPARVEIHPPVPAAELPPLPEEKKPSFLKRDLSFRRKPKADAPVEPDAPAEDAEAAPAGKTGLLKRDLSFKRRPKAEKPERTPRRRREDGEPEPVAEEAPEPKQPKERRRAKSSGGGRQKKVVGLKIGASQLAAARVHNNGSAHLVQLARQELEPGVVVGGELRDPEALAVALKDFFKTHKLPKAGVRLGIANNRIGVRTFDLAGIEDPKQLANAIRFRAQEALPIPIEEAVLDYRVLGESVDEEGATSRRILLVVAYRDLVDRYVEACRKAGIKLAGIDLEAFALLRALGAPPEGDDWVAEAATVAVAIGHERSTFAVSDGRVCEFTRVLDWGGASLNVAIARALDLAPSEAEPIKRELSLAAETEVDGLDADQVAQAREAVLRQVQGFARELVSSLQFYQGQPGSLGIAEISITGGTAHLPGLAAELERLIGVRVRVADPLARVRVGKKVADDDDEQIGSLAVAIGLGIED